jgi:ribose transport system permease protein
MSQSNPTAASQSLSERIFGAAGSNRRSIIIAYFFVLVLIAVGGALAPGFVAPHSLLQQLVLASILGVLCIGQMIVILTGNIDLSVAWTMNLCSVIVTSVTRGENQRVTEAIALSLLVGAGIGLFNGLGVAYLRLPSMVMTLGVNAMLQGVTLVVTGAQPKGNAPEVVRWLIVGRIGPIPVSVFLWAILSIITIFILSRTVFGRSLYAGGNNQIAAYLSGLRMQRNLVLAFVICGLCNALGGILLCGYGGQSYLSMGVPYQLPAIAAVVVGGTSILGGSGSYVGVIAGSIILVLLQNVLSLARVKYAGQLIIYGLAILFMLFIYGRQAADRD